jgi:hypothetical protein
VPGAVSRLALPCDFSGPKGLENLAQGLLGKRVLREEPLKGHGRSGSGSCALRQRLPLQGLML